MLAGFGMLRSASGTEVSVVGGGSQLGDLDWLAAHRVRIALQTHAPFSAAVQAVYDTLKALREGVPPSELKNTASPELMRQVTRADNYLEPPRVFALYARARLGVLRVAIGHFSARLRNKCLPRRIGRFRNIGELRPESSANRSGSVVSLFDRSGRFFVPTEAQGDAAHSRGQDWPQATAGGGAQRSGRRRARR
jgi:hypothetical protein